MMEYGCIGEKLGHSFSKEIHAGLFDYQYELVEIEKENLSVFMQAHDFKAINVTIPYKQAVIPFLSEISEQARAIGAVNTIVNRNGKLYGYNTDFSGMQALIARAGLNLKGQKVLICGSGGTSKTALAVAHEMGAAEVYRLSRTQREGCILYDTAVKQHADAGIIINTTPCGMFPVLGNAPLDLDCFPKLNGVVDAIYNPLRSALVQKALDKGLKATGGLYMLVYQAAAAAEKFTGTSVPQNKIDTIYRELYYKKQNIVLIGMPGSGKTTVGKELAARTGRPFIDTDVQIVQQQGKSIPDIFHKDGESGFRAMESRVIREVSAGQGCVIATGGGAVHNMENVAFLKENGRLYFLDRSPDDICPTADRPLSSDRASLWKRYRERYDIYCRSADKILKCEQGVAETAAAVEKDFYK